MTAMDPTSTKDRIVMLKGKNDNDEIPHSSRRRMTLLTRTIQDLRAVIQQLVLVKVRIKECIHLEEMVEMSLISP